MTGLRFNEDCRGGARPSPTIIAAITAMMVGAGAVAAAAEPPASPIVAEARAASADFAALRTEAAQLSAELSQLAQAAPAADAGAGAGAGSATARLAIRVNQLEEDLRSATGRVEELTYRVRRLEERLDKFIADVDYRLGEQGRTGAAAAPDPRSSEAPPIIPPTPPGGPRVLGPVVQPPSASPPPATAPAAPPSPQQQTAAVPPAAPSGSVRDDYARAFAFLQKGSYAEAEAAFSGFLRQHNDDPLADNARYWLGESFYARADYQRAAEAFLDAYEKSKTGPKAPDTLLKLGMSLGHLGKTKEACASFRELARAFPDAAAAIKDRAQQEQQKLKCS